MNSPEIGRTKYQPSFTTSACATKLTLCDITKGNNTSLTLSQVSDNTPTQALVSPSEIV